MARRHIFTCDVCDHTVTTPDGDEKIPPGWAVLSGIRADAKHVLAIEVCSGECAALALKTPSIKQHLNPVPVVLALPPKKN
jgi:hypothetical protein